MHGNRSKAPGIVPLAIDTIFAYIEETPEKEFLFRCSYIEIYNECVNDLLSNSLNLQLQEDKVRGIKIVGAVEEVCKSADQVFSLLQIGETNKQIGSTNYNLRSSRSHSIFRLTIESKSREAGGKGLTIATCNLIDLAGSESMKAHGPASSIHRKREMNYINKVSSI
jgi:centromeric protein E